MAAQGTELFGVWRIKPGACGPAEDTPPIPWARSIPVAVTSPPTRPVSKEGWRM